MNVNVVKPTGPKIYVDISDASTPASFTRLAREMTLAQAKELMQKLSDAVARAERELQMMGAPA